MQFWAFGRLVVAKILKHLRRLMPQSASSRTAPNQLADEQFVLAKCDYFVDVQLWPRQATLSARQWLDNFEPDERPYAVHLLNAFLYFSHDLTDALLRGAFADLSRRVVDFRGTLARAEAQWGDFLRSVVVTFPTGEHPSVTDSGLTFARKARQVLGIPESRIMSPEETLRFLAGQGRRHVVFLDDFLGTGNQFLTTWHRKYLGVPMASSFDEAAARGLINAYYVPLVACSGGTDVLAAHVPTVVVAPAHELPDEYSALHPQSILWPDAELTAAQDVIQNASMRAGIPDTGGASTQDWQGFRRLGLALAFGHGVPDATLPLFYWSQNDWQALVERT